MRFTHFRTLCLIVAISLPAAPAARAAYTMTVLQNGSEVDVNGSGSIDYTDLDNVGTGSAKPQMQPNVATLWLGNPNFLVSNVEYLGISGPTSFGSGLTTNASGGAGDFVGVWGGGNMLFVPQGYNSGFNLGSDLNIYSGQTIASLGLTDGTYTWTWGSGADADSLTIQVGPAPEPASLGLIAMALPMLLRRRSPLTA